MDDIKSVLQLVIFFVFVFVAIKLLEKGAK